jgi:hypothetical protein
MGDDKPGAFSVHPDLPRLTVAQLECYHQRYLERGDTATALVLARLAASKAASKLSKEMHRRHASEYVHPAGLVSEWLDPDRRPDVQKRHHEYLKSHPNGVKWRNVRKWLDAAARNELWERQLIVAEMLAMLAERVTQSDASKLVEIARQVQTQRNSEALLRHLRKKHYPDYAAVFTEPPRDLEDNLKREWSRVACELILAVDAWPMDLGYGIVAELVSVALKLKINSEQVRHVIDVAQKSASK